MQRRRWRTASIAALSAIVPLATTPAHAQGVAVGYTASLYVARGTYPTDRVTGAYVFNGLDVTVGPVRTSLSVPFLTQRTSPRTLDPLIGDVLPEHTSTGFGDPLVRVDVRVFQDRSRTLQIGVAGSVKAPVVDPSTGRGTGETDVAGGGTVFKAAGRTSFFGDLLYWSYGDPDGVEYEDMFSYSVGIGRVIGQGRWASMLSLGGFSQGIAGVAAPLQVNIALLRIAGQHQSVAVTAGAGLTDGSEDFSFGVSWRIAR